MKDYWRSITGTCRLFPVNYKMREDSSAWFLTASPSNYYESEMKEDELKDITVDNRI